MDILTATPVPGLRTQHRLRDEAGIRFALAEATLVATVLVVALLGLHPAATLVVLAVATAAGAVRLPVAAALGLGASAWAFSTGFLENRLGQLSLSGQDAEHLGLLLGAALVAAVVGLVVPGGRRG